MDIDDVNLPLAIDGELAKELGKRNSVIVIGYKYAGKSKCKTRLEAQGLLSDYGILDISSDSVSAEEGYRTVQRVIQERGTTPIALFLTSHHLRMFDERFKRENKGESLLGSLAHYKIPVRMTELEAKELFLGLTGYYPSQSGKKALDSFKKLVSHSKRGKGREATDDSLFKKLVSHSKRGKGREATVVPMLISASANRIKRRRGTSESLQSLSPDLVSKYLEEEETLLDIKIARTNYITSSLGLSSAELSGILSVSDATPTAVDYAKRYVDQIIPAAEVPALLSILPAATFAVSSAGLSLLGFVVIKGLWDRHKHGKRKSILGDIAGANEHWNSNELTVEEKRLIGYDFDLKNNLTPGDGFDFLNKLFERTRIREMDTQIARYFDKHSEEIWQEFIDSKAGKTLSDKMLAALSAQFQHALNDHSEAIEQLEDKLRDIRSDIAEILQRLSLLQTDMTGVKTDVTRLQHRQAGLERELAKATQASSISQGIEEIEGDVALRKYYRVEPDAAILHFQSYSETLHRLAARVGRWRPGQKPILLITGPAGAGKSWFCYQLISSLNINTFAVRTRAFSFHPTVVEGGADAVDEIGKHVFVLDDNQFDVGEKRTKPLTAEDLVEFMVSLESGESTPTGPLVLSMKADTWEAMVASKVSSDTVGNLVEVHNLSRLGLGDGTNLIRSLLETRPNVEMSESMFPELLRRSEGLPLIVKLFFDKMSSRSSTVPVHIAETDLDEVYGEPRGYCARLVFDYYLTCEASMDNPRPLAVLELIATRKEVPLVAMRAISLEIGVAGKAKDNLTGGSRPPLYEIDRLGFLHAYHQSVNEAVQALVSTESRNNMLGRLGGAQMDACVRNLNHVASRISNEVSKVESLWSQTILKEIREIIRNGKMETGEECYALFALMIEASRHVNSFPWSDFTSLRNEVGSFLFSNGRVFQDIYERAEGSQLTTGLAEQLSELLFPESTVVSGDDSGILRLDSGCRPYYETLLKCNQFQPKARAWMHARQAIQNGLTDKRTLRSLVAAFSELLVQEDKRERLWAWRVAQRLLWSETFNWPQIAPYFSSFLVLLVDDTLRREAWHLLRGFVSLSAIDDEFLSEHLTELMIDERQDVRFEAWRLFNDAMDEGCFSDHALAKGFRILVREGSFNSRLKTWREILNYAKTKPSLVTRHLVKDNFDSFDQLLKDYQREDAWILFEKMIIKQQVNEDMVMTLLEELLSGPSHKLKNRATDILLQWKARNSPATRIINVDKLLPSVELDDLEPRQETQTVSSPAQTSSFSVAVTGTAKANPSDCKTLIARRLDGFLKGNPTWYIGSSGMVDETVAEYLGRRNQRVVVVAETQQRVSARMGRIVKKYGFKTINADEQETQSEIPSQSARNKFLESHADTIVLLWDGRSSGISRFVRSLEEIGKNPIVEMLPRH